MKQFLKIMCHFIYIFENLELFRIISLCSSEMTLSLNLHPIGSRQK